MLMLALSAGCKEEPLAVAPRDACGVQLSLSFGPEQAGPWRGRLEVRQGRAEVRTSSGLESSDRLQPAEAGLRWDLHTADRDSDGLTVRLIPNDFEAPALEVLIHDEINGKTLEYTYAQFREGLIELNPVDRSGWRHLLELKGSYDPNPCS